MTDYRIWLVVALMAGGCGLLSFGVLKFDLGIVVKMMIAVAVGLVIVQDLAITRSGSTSEDSQRRR